MTSALAEESQMLDELHEHVIELREEIHEVVNKMAAKESKTEIDLEKIKKALGVKEEN